MKRPTVTYFRKMKEEKQKIAMITAYDAPTAAMAVESGVDLLLVGDSVASNILGYRNTMALTLEESLHHCKAARRGAPEAFIIGDMPFMTFQNDLKSALENAARYIREADCDAVKLEGGKGMVPVIEKMVSCGIPVMGHIGLLPQKVKTSGGYRIAGKTDDAAASLMEDARQLEEAGCFAVVLECMPQAVGAKIAEAVSIPCIGIGAGPACDGQVQVVTDVFGIGSFCPKHARCFGEVGALMKKALSEYTQAVKEGKFPAQENCF